MDTGIHRAIKALKSGILVVIMTRVKLELPTQEHAHVHTFSSHNKVDQCPAVP